MVREPFAHFRVNNSFLGVFRLNKSYRNKLKSFLGYGFVRVVENPKIFNSLNGIHFNYTVTENLERLRFYANSC